MQKKKLATKIASILLSAAMLVSTTMTAFATDGEVSVVAEQTEVQTVAETADDEALEANEEDAAAGEEIAEGETAAEEETVADEEIIEEIVSEEAQENVEEAQVLDASEVAAEENEIAVADENISTVSGLDWKKVNDYIEYAYGEGRTILYFELTDAGKNAGEANKSLPYVYDAKQSKWFQEASTDTKSTVQKVVVGEGITGIGGNNFNNVGGNYPELKEVTLSSTVTTIGEGAFLNSNIEQMNFQNVTSIGKNAFYKSAIKTVQLEKNNTVAIGEYAFSECDSLQSFTSEEGAVTLSGYSFQHCPSLESFACKGEVTEIPYAAFFNCPELKTFNVKGVKAIRSQAFWNCEALTAFDFSKVEDIGSKALESSGITTILFNNKELSLAEYALSGTKVTSICYPGTKDEWAAVSEDAAVPSEANIHCKASAVTEKSGPYYCDACGAHYRDRTAQDPDPGTETEHKWSAWKTKTPATVFKEEVQIRTCSDCGKTETRTVGKKLTPTITVNARKMWLQIGQKTSAFKVSGLANGDSVKSYKSSNTKIFTVTNKGVIKAGKKVGTAKLTVTLASGTKKVIPIVVQKRQVKTWHIYNLPAKVTLKKGATYKLSPVISLITSTHKVTYKTSNKKIATVTSAGKIKGVKKGTATITVKSGTITKKVKVTVK